MENFSLKLSGLNLEFDIKEVNDSEYHYTLRDKKTYEIAGIAIVTWTAGDDFVWLKLLFVPKKYRLKGIATHLVKVLLNYNCYEVRLRARPFYDKKIPIGPLVRFFSNQGFRVVDGGKQGPRSRLFPIMKSEYPRRRWCSDYH